LYTTAKINCNTEWPRHRKAYRVMFTICS